MFYNFLGELLGDEGGFSRLTGILVGFGFVALLAFIIFRVINATA